MNIFENAIELYKKKEYDKAIEIFNDCLESNLELERSQLAIVACYYKKWDLRNAWHYLDLYLNKYPSNSKSKKLKEEIVYSIIACAEMSHPDEIDQWLELCQVIGLDKKEVSRIKRVHIKRVNDEHIISDKDEALIIWFDKINKSNLSKPSSGLPSFDDSYLPDYDDIEF